MSDRLGSRRLYLCTPDRPDLVPFVAACIRGGVDLVQLREKRLEGRALVARARQAAEVCRDNGVPLIVNDRPDVALDAGADGVHVGQEDVSPAVARRIVGPDALVGLSTHTSEELAASAAAPVDYISVGPVVTTPTKPGRRGTGPGYVSLACEKAAHPFFVTGGVTPDTVGALVDLGARRFVVVRYLTEADDPERAARLLAARLPAP